MRGNTNTAASKRFVPVYHIDETYRHHAINPATLKHFCLDMVDERNKILRSNENKHVEHGALDATLGLLEPLTGRCLALRTSILRRVGDTRDNSDRDSFFDRFAAAEEASYVEWASFIRSIRGTVEKFAFEQAKWVFPHLSHHKNRSRPGFRVMDGRFQRFLLPVIISGNWPCVKMLELQGVGGSDDLTRKAALTMELRAVFGEDVQIVVEEVCLYVHDFQERFCWE